MRGFQPLLKLISVCLGEVQKCSNELSTKALLGWKQVLVERTFRIQTVLEWVLKQVILLSSCFYSVNKNEMEWPRGPREQRGPRGPRGLRGWTQETLGMLRKKILKVILQKCRWRKKVKWRSALASPGALKINKILDFEISRL